MAASPSAPSPAQTQAPPPAAASTTTAAPTTAGPSFTIAEQNFVNSVHKVAGADLGTANDPQHNAALVALGHAVCGVLDAGGTPTDADAELLKDNTKAKPEDIGAFVGVAVVTLCPTHTAELGS